MNSSSQLTIISLGTGKKFPKKRLFPWVTEGPWKVNNCNNFLKPKLSRTIV